MPIKCLYCRRHYARAGPYERHLRTAHANLDIVLASTIRHTPTTNPLSDTGNDLLQSGDLPGNGERTDSDYESDPGPGGCMPDATSDDVAQESDAEVLDVPTASMGSRPTVYPGAGQPIGEVDLFDEGENILSEHPWAPFTSAQDFKLASWFVRGKVSKSRINEYFSSGLGNSASGDFCSTHTLENYLRILDPCSSYLQWFEGQVDDGQTRLSFFYRDVLGCVRYLLRQIAYRDDLVYAPQREYDHNGRRVYAEMHTADWWWDVQVCSKMIHHLSVQNTG